MSDEHGIDDYDDEDIDEDLAGSWPVKGPATPRQALVAIAFVFFLGLALGFLLAQSF